MGIQGGSTNSQSSQNSYGYTQNLAQSMSGQNVWGPQAGALGNMYRGASNLAGQQSSQISPVANRLAASGGATNAVGLGALSNLAQTGGALASYADPNSALAQRMLTDATTNIANQFQRITLPGIQGQAGQTGMIGGGRQGIAQGLAASDAQDQIKQAGTSIYSNMYHDAASSAAALTDTRLQAASALPGATQAAYNLGMSPFQSQWSPFAQLSSVLGGPTVLSSAVSQALGQGENWGTAQSSGKQSNFGLKLWG